MMPAGSEPHRGWGAPVGSPGKEEGAHRGKRVGARGSASPPGGGRGGPTLTTHEPHRLTPSPLTTQAGGPTLGGKGLGGGCPAIQNSAEGRRGPRSRRGAGEGEEDGRRIKEERGSRRGTCGPVFWGSGGGDGGGGRRRGSARQRNIGDIKRRLCCRRMMNRRKSQGYFLMYEIQDFRLLSAGGQRAQAEGSFQWKSRVEIDQIITE